MTGFLVSSLTRGKRALAAAAICLTALLPGVPALADPIRGAGSTFAAPIINQWSRDYEALRTDGGDYTSPDWQVDYELVGSLAGIMRLDQREIDFAATDAPLPAEELAKRGFAQFPIVMGGIAVVANLDGIGAGQLRLSGPVLADIYLGKITRWSDPVIAALNPGLTLPEADIAVLHRVDGSGSTLAFTGYLARSSEEWRGKLGSDTLITWPVGRGEKGTSGLSTLAAATKNSISYLEYGQVVRAGLPFVSLENDAGAFVHPDADSFRAALSADVWDPATGARGTAGATAAAGAYPIAVVTYAVLPGDRGRTRVNRVLDLFRLAYGRSDAASALGYVPVSPELAARIEDYWKNSFASVNN